MNSKQLQYFLVTAQNGSIAGAARELDIAQPAISQQLANLEREMGAELFARSFKGVSLTAAGKVFARHAKKLVEDINVAKIDLQQLASSSAGKVRLGLLPSIGNVLSLPLIAYINNKHPNVSLEMNTGPSYAVKQWLQSNQIDIALTFELGIDSDLMTTHQLIDEYMYLVVGVNEASPHFQMLRNRETINFWELSQFELLTPGRKDALGQLIHKYERDTGVALKHDKAYSGQLMTGLRQVIQGQGLMILPSSAMFHLESNEVVKTLKIIEPDMRRQVLLATNKSASLSDTSLRMIDVIRRVTAQEQRLNNWRGKLVFSQKD